MKIKIAFSLLLVAFVSMGSIHAQSRYLPRTSVHLSIGINQPPVYYSPRPVVVYPRTYASRTYYHRYHRDRYYRSRPYYQSRHMPPGQLKKIYGHKSVKSHGRGHKNYKHHRR